MARTLARRVALAAIGAVVEREDAFRYSVTANAELHRDAEGFFSSRANIGR